MNRLPVSKDFSEKPPYFLSIQCEDLTGFLKGKRGEKTAAENPNSTVWI
jgi:hypothetical protein